MLNKKYFFTYFEVSEVKNVPIRVKKSIFDHFQIFSRTRTWRIPKYRQKFYILEREQISAKKANAWRRLNRPSQLDMVVKLARLYLRNQATPTAKSKVELASLVSDYYLIHVEGSLFKIFLFLKLFFFL